jgi:hypothetical protein
MGRERVVRPVCGGAPDLAKIGEDRVLGRIRGIRVLGRIRGIPGPYAKCASTCRQLAVEVVMQL